MQAAQNIGRFARELGGFRHVLWSVERPGARPGEGQGARAAREKAGTGNPAAEAIISEPTLEVDFFKGALQTVKLDASGIPRLPRGIYDENPSSDALASQLAEVSRAGFYQYLVEIEPTRKRRSCVTPSRGFSWSTGDTAGTAASPLSGAVEACWSTGSVWRGGSTKTI